jgi:arylformamidase
LRIIDISNDMFTAPVYPGDPVPSFELISRIDELKECNLSAFTACCHSGTHADAPLHFISEGCPIDEVPLENFIGPCTVIEVNKGPITGEWVNNHFPRKCERLLVKGNGKAWFMDSAAEETAYLGIKLIGIDGFSVGCHGAQIKPHKAFLGRGISVLEGLNLTAVKPGNYFLVAPPLKLGGLEAAPVRAALVDDYIFWGGKAK